ncbi:MAG: hypothetical protein LBQ44_02005 [Treponema sp.]|jgi:hypothetical protein|nr:hypothetical protein [Treponema sp.]
MKKTVFFVTFALFCSLALSAQNMSLPSSRYYEQQLGANGCGAADGYDFPDFVFKAACDMHDLDYLYLGRAKIVSDLRFLGNMAKACADTFGSNKAALTGCLAVGSVYFIGVLFGGGDAYNKAQVLARNLRDAKERERGICYPSDVFVQQSGNAYLIAIDW